MRAGERGFTLPMVLVVLATCMLGLALAGPIWAQQVRREREQELLRIGRLYAEAIASYRDASPGSAKQYPRLLEDLLLDTRFVGIRRHLRRLYEDPMNPGQAWGVIRDADQRILGVYSQSADTPLRRVPVTLGLLRLGPAAHYSDWKFIVEPRS